MNVPRGIDNDPSREQLTEWQQLKWSKDICQALMVFEQEFSLYGSGDINRVLELIARHEKIGRRQMADQIGIDFSDFQAFLRSKICGSGSVIVIKEWAIEKLKSMHKGQMEAFDAGEVELKREVLEIEVPLEVRRQIVLTQGAVLDQLSTHAYLQQCEVMESSVYAGDNPMYVRLKGVPEKDVRAVREEIRVKLAIDERALLSRKRETTEFEAHYEKGVFSILVPPAVSEGVEGINPKLDTLLRSLSVILGRPITIHRGGSDWGLSVVGVSESEVPYLFETLKEKIVEISRRWDRTNYDVKGDDQAEVPDVPEKFKYHDLHKGWSQVDANTLVYEGPIYRITYPKTFARNEVRDFRRLGYFTEILGDDKGNSKVAIVYNHFDPVFKKTLEELGAKFETEVESAAFKVG